MIVMPGSHISARLGYLAGRFPGRVGNLFSPGDQKGPFEFLPYALDNGAFSAGDEWKEGPWVGLLQWARLRGHLPPRWVLVPDVVGDRAATLARWLQYAPIAREYKWPLAFAVQDGMSAADVPPGAELIFVGGSTQWKWATMRRWCADFPRAHIGRVNTYHRLWECHDAGAESVDGSGWFRGDHGSGKPWRAISAYLEESTPGLRRRSVQEELIA